MSSLGEPPEVEIVPELVSEIIQIFDPKKLSEIGINSLIESLANFIFRIRNVKISHFQLSRAQSSIPIYSPGAFPIGFVPIKTLKDLTTVTPIIVFADFEVTQIGSSEIKAKGIGELSIYKKGNKIIVKARNIWHIEEVKKVSPPEESKKLAKELEKFIKKVLVAFIAKLLAELATKALIGS